MKISVAIGTLLWCLLLSGCCLQRHCGQSSSKIFLLIPPATRIMAPPSTVVIEDPNPDLTPRARTPTARPGLGTMENPLPVVPRDQEGTMTCWAASSEMIMEFIRGDRIFQCEQTDLPNDLIACCEPGDLLNPIPECNYPRLPRFSQWNFINLELLRQPLSWQAIKDEINAGRPFAFSLINRATADTPHSTSHMRVAIGYAESGIDHSLIVLNPRPFLETDAEFVTYNDYCGLPAVTTATAPTPSRYIHQYDFYQIESLSQ